MELTDWTSRPRPQRTTLAGRVVRLEPYDAARHAADVFAAGREGDVDATWWYLTTPPLVDDESFAAWSERAQASTDPFFYAIVDAATNRAVGRLAFMRIEPAHGVIEIGHVLFGPRLKQTAGATESIHLLARYVFDVLGYRRLEWKCDNLNEPSKRAALRFGFTPEGVFRQHMVIKGRSRDTAWFAMLDHEWPAIRARFQRWLDPSNFDEAGRQRSRLGD